MIVRAVEAVAGRGVAAGKLAAGTRVDENAGAAVQLGVRVVEVAAVLESVAEASIGALEAYLQRGKDQPFDTDRQLVLPRPLHPGVHGDPERTGRWPNDPGAWMADDVRILGYAARPAKD